MASSHTALVNACIDYIALRGGMGWKTQSGVLPVQGRYVHAGKKGLPDVVGVIPRPIMANGEQVAPTWVQRGADRRYCVGQLVAVEVKTGSGRLSAVQRRIHNELAKRGALVLVVRDITELQEALR